MDEIIPSTIITQVCAQRDAALARMREAVGLMVKGRALVDDAEKHANAAHSGAAFVLSDRSKHSSYQRIFAEINADQSLETYRQQLDARVWMNLFVLTGMNKMMDKTAKDELYETLCADVPEVTEDNIRATLQGLFGDSRLIFQRGLARAFIDLDRRFKSHDAFKIGARVILTRVFNEFGSWNYGSRMRDTLTDIERVFAVLDGKEPDGHKLIDVINDSRSGGGYQPRQGYVETAYFRIRSFQNGNAHLWFTRDDLVEKANLELAAYYGEVLPDAFTEDVTVDDVRTTALSKDLAFYATPPGVADRALRDVSICSSSVVLEPSAGEGGLVRDLLERGARVHAIEIDTNRVSVLRGIRSSRLEVEAANFLTVHPVPKYTHVVMNPPFNGTHWMAHVRHAFDFLGPQGTLVAILPVSAQLGDSKKHEAFLKWAERYAPYGRPSAMFHDLPAESFIASGTRVNTVVLTLCSPR